MKETRRSISIEVDEGVELLLSVETLGRVLEHALEAAGAPAVVEVGLILSDDAELAKLNAEHMGQEGPTDVLSFPLLPPGAYPPHLGQDPAVRLEQSDPAFATPPDAPTHLGDIVISVERAVAQAAEGQGGQTGDVRWSAADELRLLVIHGALHLCGWDHADPEEESAMRAQEHALLVLTAV